MRRMMICLMLAIAPALMAEQTNYGSGGTSAAFLKIPGSVRGSGMADATVGLDMGAGSLSSNPANLDRIAGQQLGLAHNVWIQGVSAEHLGWGMPLMGKAGLAASFDYLSYGSVDRVKVNSDGTLSNDGSFTPSACHLDLGYGQHFGSLAGGLAVKVISESIDSYSASGFAADLGLAWRPESLPAFGLSVRNLGSQMGGSDLPSSAKLGLLQDLEWGGKAMNLGLDAMLPFADSKAVSLGLGLELWLTKAFAIRTGYRAQDRGALAGLSGLAAGFSAKISMLQLDYALNTLGDLGQSHQFGLSANF